MPANTNVPLLNVCDDAVLLIAVHLNFFDRLNYLRTHRRFWHVLKKCPPRSINMCNTSPNVVQGVLSWVADNCPRVRSLNLHGHTVEGLEQSVLSALDNCEALEVFNVQHCPDIGDEVVRKVAAKCSDTLRQISLWDTGKGEISKAALIELVQNCPKLEILDLRGQKHTDDDVLEVLGTLRRLRKVALAGTRGSGYAFSKLLADQKNSMQRMGCFQLEPRNRPSPLVFESSSLEELQVGGPRPTLPLMADISKLPKLRFLGVSAMHQLDSFIDWEAVVDSSVTQIMADGYNLYPPRFMRCLSRMAHKLKYLSLSMISQDEFREILPKCVELRQLSVDEVDAGLLYTVAKLPKLEYLNMAMPVEPSVLREFLDEVALHDEQVFPSLTNVFLGSNPWLSDDEDDEEADPESLARFIGKMQKLAGLYIRCTPEELMAVLMKGITPSHLKCLTLCKPMGDTSAVLSLIAKMKDLTRLWLTAEDLSDSKEDVLATAATLPNLKVLGHNRSEVHRPNPFTSWFQLPDGRFLRMHDPYGYDEQDGIKPFDQFVNFLEEDIDPIYPVMEP